MFSSTSSNSVVETSEANIRAVEDIIGSVGDSVEAGSVVVVSIVVTGRCDGTFDDTVEVSIVNCGVVSVVLASVVSSDMFVVVMVEIRELVEVEGSVELDSIPVDVSMTACVGEVSITDGAAVVDLTVVVSKVVAVVSEVTSLSIDVVITVDETILVVSCSIIRILALILIYNTCGHMFLRP